jgi:hypothetical protein
MHKEKSLSKSLAKIEKECTSKSPNALCTREKYFASLPFDPYVNPIR